MRWRRTAPAQPERTVRGVPLTDASALAGGCLWVAAVVVDAARAGPPAFGPIDRALALAPLVLVPLGLGLAATPPLRGRVGRAVDAAVLLQPVAAAALLAAVLLPRGPGAAALAIPWLSLTAMLAFAAADRLRRRGPAPLAETAVDAGLVYAVVGAGALVGHLLGISLWFRPVIVHLTAVHFHYAGFVLPLVVGLTGRALHPDPGPLYRVVAAVAVVGPAIIAVGIAASPAIEVVAVAGFTVAVAAFGVLVAVRVAPERSRLQGLALAVSGLLLPVSMALALGYALATAGIADVGLPIGRMVALHGSVNAFGFALVATVGWRLAPPSRVR